MDHTKEPWKLETENADTSIIGADDQLVVAGEFDGYMVPFACRESREALANARRIVACVNACAGIDTEHLKIGKPIAETVASLRSALSEKTAQVEQYRTTVEEVTRQRNEAREQLERYTKIIVNSEMFEDHSKWLEHDETACELCRIAREAPDAPAPKEDLDA